MKKKCVKYPILIIVNFIISASLIAQNVNFVPGEFLVKMKPNNKSTKNSLKKQLRANTLKIVPKLDMEVWQLDSVNDLASIQTLINQYVNHPEVDFIEPNYIWSVNDSIPNDPNFSKQWGLYNTEQTIRGIRGYEDVDIDLQGALCMDLTLNEVVVGILDTGIDWKHEDLVDNIWNNLGEDADGDGKVLEKINGAWMFDPDDENGVDDDGNGYIDDFIGWDFVNGDNNPYDGNSHGTHCAGTIGASVNNNIGIAGVAPNVKLAALKFLADNGKGSTTAAIEALSYAIDMGIPITNNSWGSYSYSYALYEAIQHAENTNHLFIAAAGNYSTNNDQYAFYPASYVNENIVSVASINNRGQLSDFSNYGLISVDITAPGKHIFSCVPGNLYAYKSGTSMAAPHVTGICTWLKGIDLNIDYSTVKSTLINSTANTGYVNLEAALIDLEETPCYKVLPPCDRNADSLVLVALYNSISNITDSTNWRLQNSISDWGGVQFNELGCVKGIRLYNAGLSGTLPPEIGNFSSIKYLRFDGGQQLSGPIPEEIGNLQSLKELELFVPNNSGNIPEEIYNLSSLKRLLLWGPFTGSISSKIGQLTKLEKLLIGAGFGNRELINLTGEIPTEIGSLTNLTELGFAYQTFSGGVPSTISELTNLEDLYLRDNHLSGDIGWLANLTSIRSVDILDNQFTGAIPPGIGNFKHLVNLLLGNNGLTGTIPSEICNCNYLESIFLGNSQLTGSLPACFGYLSELHNLSVYSNELTGNIPAELGFLTKLSNLYLNDNELDGSVPLTLGNLQQLTEIDFSNNNLNGCFPDQLSSLCHINLNNDVVNNGNTFNALWEDFCNNGNGSCGSEINKVWPGDFNHNGKAEVTDILYWGLAFGNTGPARPNAVTDWQGQDVESWENTVKDINGKHQDGDGNGIIDIADLNVLKQNFDLLHNFSLPENFQDILVFNFNRNFESSVANDNPDIIEYELYIKDTGSSAVNVHGFSASISFGHISVDSAYINLDNTIFQGQHYVEHFDKNNNQLHFGLTKTDGFDTDINNNDVTMRLMVEVIAGDTGTGNSFGLEIYGNTVNTNAKISGSIGSTFYDVLGSTEPSENNIVLNGSSTHVNCYQKGSAKILATGGSGNYWYEWDTGETTQEINNLSPGIYGVKVCDKNNGVEEKASIEVFQSLIPIYDAQGILNNCSNNALCPSLINFEKYLPIGNHRAGRIILTNANSNNGGKVELFAGERIKFSSGFTTRNLISFSAKIQACE